MDGRRDMYVRHRASATWGHWQKPSGVLCDRKMLVKLKGKPYGAAVIRERPIKENRGECDEDVW